jgi:hypothetical protein
MKMVHSFNEGSIVCLKLSIGEMSENEKSKNCSKKSDKSVQFDMTPHLDVSTAAPVP